MARPLRPHRRVRTRLVIGALLVGALLAGSALATTPVGGAATKPKLPPIKHVFVVNLENHNFDATWGANSEAPYLSQTLKAQGAFLSEYYSVSHVSLGNYIAQISGQGPSLQTQSDCSTYNDFQSTGTGELGQVLGDGCVYPASTSTIADQLTAKGLTWKGYMEDMATPCLHPALGAGDPYFVATATSAYATRHNPFVYFHSIIDSPACAENDVPLTALEADLASVKTTANYSMITPNQCNDGHDASCANGGPGGLTAANAWLQRWVPKILDSPAFKKDGLLVITFDEAESHGTNADVSACCNTVKPANVENASALTPGPGGGKVGALLISRFIAPGTTSATPYNHYALLGSIEDLFRLPHLGLAQDPGLTFFGTDVYTNAKAAAKTKTKTTN